jgi:hypothetical protein
MPLSNTQFAAFPGYYGTPFFYNANPNKTGVNNNGGVVLGVSAASRQNSRIFDTDFGYPYLGITHAYTDNKPVIASALNGVAKSITAGTFAVMAQDKYIMMGFTSQIAGISNSLYNSPGFSAGKGSQNIANLWRNTWKKRTTGGWYYQTGAPVNAQYSRDKISNEVLPTYANPGRITYLQGALTAFTTSYHAKTD